MILCVAFLAAFVVCFMITNSIVLGYLAYCFIGTLIAVALAVVVSLLLGRPRHFALTKIRGVNIIDTQEDGYVIETGEVIYHNEIKSTVYSDEVSHPRVRIFYYDHVGWRSWFLLPIYDNRREYILYLPRKDET